MVYEVGELNTYHVPLLHPLLVAMCTLLSGSFVFDMFVERSIVSNIAATGTPTAHHFYRT